MDGRMLSCAAQVVEEGLSLRTKLLRASIDPVPRVRNKVKKYVNTESKTYKIFMLFNESHLNHRN